MHLSKYTLHCITFLLLLSSCKSKDTKSELDSLARGGIGQPVPGIYLKTGRWSSPSAIPVCWSNPSGPGVTAAMKNDIRSVITREFNRTHRIKFVGWGNCSSANHTVRIHLRNDMGFGGGLSYVGDPGTRRLSDYGYPNATMYVGIKSYATNANAKAATLASALHEFGHAAGLMHEHQRSDSVCDAKKWGQETLHDHDPGIEYVGGYDPNSAMNYCNSDDAAFSQGDINTLNKLYPKDGFETNWLSVSNGQLGPLPVYSGQVLGYHLNVCSAHIPNYGFQAGHIVNGQTQCFVAYGNGVVGYPSYRVLDARKGYSWVDRNHAKASSDYIKVSYQGTQPTGVCRRKSNDPGAPFHNGKLIGSPSKGVCYASWGNSNASFSSFDVLIKN